MTPPASPVCQLKSNQVVKEESTATKLEEAVSMQPISQENLITPEKNDTEETSSPPPPILPPSTIESGQNLEIFPLPLPPTPNASPTAVSFTQRFRMKYLLLLFIFTYFLLMLCRKCKCSFCSSN